MDISNIFLTAFITIVLNAILFYVLLKYVEKRAILIASEIIEVEKAELGDSIRKYVNTEDFQKAIYQFGALFGSGAMAQTGFTKGSGKMNIKSIITQGIASFIQQKVGGFMPGQPGQPGQPGIPSLKSKDSDKLTSA